MHRFGYPQGGLQWPWGFHISKLTANIFHSFLSCAQAQGLLVLAFAPGSPLFYEVLYGTFTTAVSLAAHVRLAL